MQRQLDIKIRSCTRLLKEVKSYEGEVKLQLEKIQKLKDDNADPYQIKQQETVLQETEQVLPDSIRRLANARDTLNEFVEDNNGQLDCSNAQEVINEVDNFLKERQ